MSRSKGKYLAFWPLTTALCALAIVAACAKDLAGPREVSTSADEVVPSIGNASENLVSPRDATSPFDPAPRPLGGNRRRMTPSAGRFSLEGDTGIGGHVFAMEIEAPSGDLVTIEYRADPSGQVVDRMNFYNEGERILSTAIQWTETSSGPQVATLQQTSYYQLNPGGTTNISCRYDEFGEWRCQEAGRWEPMRSRASALVYRTLESAALTFRNRPARMQGFSPSCTASGQNALIDWVIIGMQAKADHKAGRPPTITSVPTDIKGAFDCGIYWGHTVHSAGLQGMEWIRDRSAEMSSTIKMVQFATAMYIWDKFLRPAAAGAGVGSYNDIYYRSSGCNRSLARYVCTSLSGYMNMQ